MAMHCPRTTTSSLSLIYTLTMALLAAASATAQEPLISKSLSISDLMLPHAVTQRLPFVTMLGLRRYEDWTSLVPAREDPRPAMEDDSLINLIAMTDSSLEEDDVELRTEYNRLFMRGSKAQLQRFTDLVALARNEFAAPITIDAVVIHHDSSLLPPAIVTPEQAAALIEGQEAAWRGMATAPARIATNLGAHRAVSYLHRYDVEVTENRSERIPQQDELFDGVGIVAIAHRMTSGDDLILQTQFAVSHLHALKTHEVLLPNLVELQRPEIDTTAGNMSGRIQNGGALVFNATAPADLGGNVMVVVRATWQPRVNPAPKNLLILPISSLTAPGGMMPQFSHPERIDLALPSNDNELEYFELDPLIDEGSLQERISTEIEPDAWDNTAQMQTMNGLLVATGEPALLKKVRAFVAEQEEQLLQTIEVIYDNGEGRISFPTLSEHGHGVRHGRETTGMATLVIEIATKASEVSPVMTRLFDGVQIGMQPFAIGQDHGARLHWTARRMTGTPKGRILPAIYISSHHHMGAIPESGLTTGIGPLGSETFHLQRR